MKDICLYTYPNFESGIICFNLKDFDSIELSNYLDQKYNIAVRGGLHCAPLTHEFFKTTQKGMLRVSLNFKNTKKEINVFLKSIKILKKDIKKLT